MNRTPRMRKTRYLLAAALAVFLCLDDPARSADRFGEFRSWYQKDRPRQVPGELLVKFKPSTGKLSKSSVLGKISARKIQELDDRWARVKIDHADSTDNTIHTLVNDPNVEFAQPNFIYYATGTPNDPFFSQQWGFKNTNQEIVANPNFEDEPMDINNPPKVSGNDMGLPAAWDITTDCSAVTVAVLDTGVNYNHPDLASNMWTSAAYPNHGKDFANADNDPMDYNGHGTHVAGTIAAIGNNSIGGAGICWRAKIMAVRVLNAFGAGTTSDLINGINFAVDNGAKVINLSLGGADYDSAFNSAMTRASNAGVVIVVASGNDGSDNDSSPSYPCNFTQANLICVAALDQKYALAGFSNYGKASVHVGAPGVNILSAWPGRFTSFYEDFSSGWTIVGGGWSVGNKAFPNSDGTTDYYTMLTNPASWQLSATGDYVNNANQRAYKTYDLSGANAAALEVIGWVNVETNRDYFNINLKDTGGDPFASGGNQLLHMTGTDTYARDLTYEFTHCLTSSCSIGFQLTSDASGTDSGVGIGAVSLVKVNLSNPFYNLLSGTSMATPHVTGLAAMIMAYNTGYSAADVVNSIKSGGQSVSSLANKTATGKAISAIGSLSYIKPPTNVTAVVQP